MGNNKFSHIADSFKMESWSLGTNQSCKGILEWINVTMGYKIPIVYTIEVVDSKR